MTPARISASRPFFAAVTRPALRQPARMPPRATLCRQPLAQPQGGPSCPLPKPRRPQLGTRQLSVEWHMCRVSAAIDGGDLREVMRGLDDLGRVDLVRRATCMDGLDRDGLTWLMRAARAGNLYMVQFLLSNDASAHCRDRAGLNAADWAHLGGHPLLVQALQRLGAGPHYAHLAPAAVAYLAVHLAHPALLKHMAGRDLGRPFKHRIQPPYGPAPACTHVLTDRANRFTPLTAVAHVHPNERAVEVVLQSQDAAATTLEGDPAIVLAAYSAGDASEALHQMLHKGAQVHARSREGWSLAHLIAAYCHHPLPSLQVLLDHGGDVDAVTRDGWTPLHFLLTQGDFPEAVSLLLQHGASPHQRTWAIADGAPGMSALELARIYKREASLACMQGLENEIERK